MDHSQVITDLTQNLLDNLGLTSGISIQTRFDKDSDMYQVLFESNKPALLIGYHGETLSAMQLILGQHLHSKLGMWVNLSVNVNDYRERRQSSLTALADSIVAQVISTGQPHSLPPMPANERRVIHMYLADHLEVVTASEGTGRSRYIIISPK